MPDARIRHDARCQIQDASAYGKINLKSEIRNHNVLNPVSFSNSQVIEVAMGNGVVARAPHIISSLGLGSCVAVTLYDTQRRIGGLAHVMLPDSSHMRSRNGDCTMGKKKSEIGISPYQCAETAIAALLEELRRVGADRRAMVAKMVGGARMFTVYEDASKGIGAQNIISIKHLLKGERIPLIGSDIGGNYGRSVEFHLDSGVLIVTAIGKQDREIKER